MVDQDSTPTSPVGRGQFTAAPTLLEAIDREISFYRKRAGQVFSLGLLVEVLILAGRETVVIPALRPWAKPLAYSVLFIAVAAMGITLGAEYRRRIHCLKNSRSQILEQLGHPGFYPPTGGLRLSEIEMLYVVLVFLSSCGLILVWLNPLAAEEPLELYFWALFAGFVATGTSGISWTLIKFLRWLTPERTR